jgi:hypothetical protein
MADYDWFDDRGPSAGELAAAKWRPRGFDAIFNKHSTSVSHYRCRRGCGTLVWNPEDHIKNVCVMWEPVVGE